MRSRLRGAAGIALFLLLWQTVVTLHVPYLSRVPAPLDVVRSFLTALRDGSYYADWVASARRVFVGFIIALGVGVPLGLAIGTQRRFRDLAFPVFELFRPIPPLAWIPLSILFWPTTESSIEFVIVLGGVYVIALNTVAGVEHADRRYVNAARSLGATPLTIFRRIVLPAALPSIAVGAAVAMGLTWSVLVAAEIIAGHDGLGRRTWEAYVAGAFPDIVVGMISMGLAGWASSALTRWSAARLTPWVRTA
jgi:NitT/TauT family transport system permease protein